MFRFLHRKRLVNIDAKGLAQLMYEDVSSDRWDQENSTRLLTTEAGKTLLQNHFDSFVIRLGAYTGEVIRRNSQQDFAWYKLDSVCHYSAKWDEVYDADPDEAVLYSKTKDMALFPLSVVRQFLKGDSPYPNFLS